VEPGSREKFWSERHVTSVFLPRNWKLSRRELLRLFREKAKRLHPDRGGDKEAFILLRRIFEELMEALGYRRRL